MESGRIEKFLQRTSKRLEFSRSSSRARNSSNPFVTQTGPFWEPFPESPLPPPPPSAVLVDRGQLFRLAVVAANYSRGTVTSACNFLLRVRKGQRRVSLPREFKGHQQTLHHHHHHPHHHLTLAQHSLPTKPQGNLRTEA